ncbi:PREDICTED: probable aminotransferase TAT2 [Lupinus angustifolius]|uniref:probable aminotransferase TAT2 n=1 Tax=Lupinus angustifolius TaxID=3871 RepID=UPI00092FA8FB|nr:PREDICTED: probable aminotransferase TAT2 [Lupinus angustifolius]
MEIGSISKKWNFEGNEWLNASAVSVRAVFNKLKENISNEDKRPSIYMCRVDPTENPMFRTTFIASDAIVSAVQSYNFNSYPPTLGLPDATRAIADYLSSDLPYQLSPDNVFLTIGGTQAIDIILPVLARPGANILLPRPGYPQYESRANCCRLEVRHFDLLPERGWEVDLDSLEAIADENTVAMVLINPSNPCGNVFTHQHLKRVAEAARKLGIFLISDEVYAHIAFGSNPFVPMAVFSSIVPVITIGSLSKRWFVPGWRFGWIATCDPNGILKQTGILTLIKSYLEISTDPPTIIQAAVPEILKRTKEEFYAENLNIMREGANIFYDRCKEIPCLKCPHKPEGAMSIMVQINISQLEGIIDDVDFCVKLAEEESVLLLPGVSVGLKNWLRISFAVERSALEDGLTRIKAFCLRHAKMS